MLNVTYGSDEFVVIGLPLHIVIGEGLNFLYISRGFLLQSSFISFW